MNSVFAPLPAVAWVVAAITAVGLGWARSSRILIVVGALMILVAAWNTFVYLRARGL